MAQVLNGNQIKLNNGQTIQGAEGGWYDGQQLFGGTLSAPGVINAKSPQQGAGQAVSKETVQQTNPANWAYIQQQQQTYKPAANSQPMPTGTPSTPSAAGTPGAGVGFQAPQDVFDPTKFYETAYNNSGIRDTEAALTAKSNAHNEAVAKIKDNPYLSEATMTGRIAKLDQKFAADNQTAQNDIAMKKADVETQLNLQLKKLDINNAATKQAMDQFNTLLSSGALSGASGEDIANITRATGISSNMIQSAISATKAKNAVKPTMVSFDDGTNQGFAMVDPNTGAIISKQVVAGSKILGTAQDKLIGKTSTSTGTPAATVQSNFISDTNSAANTAGEGDIFPRLVQQYATSLPLSSIYALYQKTDAYKQWGTPIEDASLIQQIYDKAKGK